MAKKAASAHDRPEPLRLAGTRLPAGRETRLVRAGSVPRAGETSTDEVVRVPGHLFMDHTAGAPAPTQHNAVGIPPNTVQDHDVTGHEAKNPRLRDGGARTPR